MTTRRSLRSAPLDLPAPRLDAENQPALPGGKHTLTAKQKLGKPRAALIDLSNVSAGSCLRSTDGCGSRDEGCWLIII